MLQLTFHRLVLVFACNIQKHIQGGKRERFRITKEEILETPPRTHRKMSPFHTKTHTSFSTIVPSLLLFFSLSLSLMVQATNSLDKEPTAYEVLGDYDFPKGLLPKGVLGYELEATSGKFSAFLNGSCSFSLEGSYQLKYKPTIKGHISKGRLSSLEGVSVKLLFIWVDIIEVSRSGDDLDFSVGIAGAGFPIDSFEESPHCGCGFNCGDNRKVTSLRKNPFVSSF